MLYLPHKQESVLWTMVFVLGMHSPENPGQRGICVGHHFPSHSIPQIDILHLMVKYNQYVLLPYRDIPHSYLHVVRRLFNKDTKLAAAFCLLAL